MLKLFDEEEVMRTYMLEVEREAKQRGMAQGLEQGMAQGLEQGLEQGMAQGLEQGLEQGQRDIAVRMLRRGMEAKDVAELCDLPVEKIEGLAATL